MGEIHLQQHGFGAGACLDRHDRSPSYLVIARLVRPDGDEVWAPVRVVRWTAEAVMICLESDQDQAPEYLWLPVGDVRRTITVPTTLTTATSAGDSPEITAAAERAG